MTATHPQTRYPSLLLAALLLAAVFSLGLASCGEEGGSAPTSDCESGVSRAGVLADQAAKATSRLNNSVRRAGELRASLVDLATETTENQLAIAREDLRAARYAFAQLGPYALLLDEAQVTLPSIAPFPVDTGLVIGYARVDSFEFSASHEFDRGYGAIEFLLYGPDSSRTLALLAAEPPRVLLALAYANHAAQALSAVETRWLEDGSEAFVEADGTAAGTGFSRLVNSLSKHYEDTRRDRLGTPFGVTLGFPSPRVLEAPYSGRSLGLLEANLAGSQSAYGALTDPVTLAAYTAGLANAEGADLAADVVAQYDAALAALAALGLPLAQAIEDERDAVQTAYNAISRQVVNLKTDLPSVTCVAITYVDNPSDSD